MREVRDLAQIILQPQYNPADLNHQTSVRESLVAIKGMKICNYIQSKVVMDIFIPLMATCDYLTDV